MTFHFRSFPTFRYMKNYVLNYQKLKKTPRSILLGGNGNFCSHQPFSRAEEQRDPFFSLSLWRTRETIRCSLNCAGRHFYPCSSAGDTVSQPSFYFIPATGYGIVFFALAYGSRVNKISRNKLFVFNGLVSLQGSKLGSDFSWRSSTSSPIDRLPDAAEPTTTSHKRSQVIRLLYAHGARLLNVNLELIGFHVKFVCLYY